MAIIDTYKNSTLGLKGETPKVKVSATAASPNIVFDPTPGSQGDEVYNVNSQLDLDGKKPATYRDSAPEEASF